MCMCVEHGDTFCDIPWNVWPLSLIIISKNMAIFSLSFLVHVPLCAHNFFYTWTFMCPYFFQYFCIAHVSFARTLVIFYACSAYLVGNDRHVFVYFHCRSIIYIVACTWSWSWDHDKFLNKGQHDLTKLNTIASNLCRKLVSSKLCIWVGIFHHWGSVHFHSFQNRTLEIIQLEQDYSSSYLAISYSEQPWLCYNTCIPQSFRFIWFHMSQRI
jgi:hypothetical protein